MRGSVVSAATPALLTRVQKELKTGRFPLTKNVPQSVTYSTGTKLTKIGTMSLNDLGKLMVQDSTMQVTLTGRVKKGEKASMAGIRADSIMGGLRRLGIAARRIRKTPQTAPVAEGMVQLALFSGSPATIEAGLNEQNPLSVQITQRAFQKGDNKVMDEMMAKAPGTYNVQKDGRYYAVTIDQTLPAGPKTLAEARGQATSDYQAYLEKEWIAQMRAAKPVKVNEAEVSKLVTK